MSIGASCFSLVKTPLRCEMSGLSLCMLFLGKNLFRGLWSADTSLLKRGNYFSHSKVDCIIVNNYHTPIKDFLSAICLLPIQTRSCHLRVLGISPSNYCKRLHLAWRQELCAHFGCPVRGSMRTLGTLFAVYSSKEYRQTYL